MIGNFEEKKITIRMCNIRGYQVNDIFIYHLWTEQQQNVNEKVHKILNASLEGYAFRSSALVQASLISRKGHTHIARHSKSTSTASHSQRVQSIYI